MKEVAAVLNVSARTVAFHKDRIMEQLEVASTAELIHTPSSTTSSDAPCQACPARGRESLLRAAVALGIPESADHPRLFAEFAHLDSAAQLSVGLHDFYRLCCREFAQE